MLKDYTIYALKVASAAASLKFKWDPNNMISDSKLSKAKSNSVICS